MRQAKRATTLLMRFYNAIVSELAGEDRRSYAILLNRIGDPPDTMDLADDWCKGYAIGMALREGEWKAAMAAPAIEDAFVPIFLLAEPGSEADLDPIENPENCAEMVDSLPKCAFEIYEWWRIPHPARHSAPKTRANAPCPCGSGKKYKRCCSPVRAI